nr:putative NADH dehydrogenase subunit 6 [Schistosoma haematobium]
MVIFTFNSSSLFRSILILVNSLIVSAQIYLEIGFSWYFLLFILVYVGGVYIILIYISMVSPNFSLFNMSFVSYYFMFGFTFIIWFCVSRISMIDYSMNIECSFYLCNSSEILVYIFLCIMLMISLVFVNFIVSLVSTNSYFR